MTSAGISRATLSLILPMWALRPRLTPGTAFFAGRPRIAATLFNILAIIFASSSSGAAGRGA
jgi:hypothetical protein